MKLVGPRITSPSLMDLANAVPGDALEPTGTDALRIEHALFEGITRHNAIYRETEFVGARVTRCTFAHCRFLDVRFDALDAPDFVASNTTWRSSEIVGSRLGAIDLHGAKINSLRLDGCKVAFLGLQGATATDLLIENCVIEELDLTGAVLSRAAFRDTTVERLRVTEARLHAMDLSQARLGAVTPVMGLRGATLSTGQLLDLAPALASELGILVD